MRRANFRGKDKSSFFIIGRGIVIATILITCSFGFIIGYLVGKSATNKNTKSTSLKTVVPIEEMTKRIQPKALVSPKEVVPQKEIVEAKKKKEGVEQQPFKKPSKAMYTVQVGAFKNVSEADILKEQLDKKGYDAYVVTSESKKRGKFYKVWIGQFSNRKKAESVSKKIKKAEGLQTFVTLKIGWESIR